ncbi:glutaredoxin 3 [Agaribacterium sp. ZY112]|uniref:glutaredoxin 3 n=1 Tax=Agaribacterium sp. ZY112 TaxID=3233574 RepID=UPI00352683BB
MSEIRIYTTRFCPFCIRAKHLLKSKSVAFREFKVDGDRAARQKLLAETGSHTVPQIWIGKHYVGGCDELYMLERSGKLDSLLAEFK